MYRHYMAVMKGRICLDLNADQWLWRVAALAWYGDGKKWKRVRAAATALSKKRASKEDGRVMGMSRGLLYAAARSNEA